MSISQPQSTDPLNAPDHALSHRVIANDDSAPNQAITVDALGNVRIGDDTNYAIFENNSKLHFVGDARPVKFYPIHSTLCEPAHHNPLSLTSLAVADGITTSGMDTSPGNTRRIKVIGIDGGVHVKGRIKASYAQGDTTHESCIVKIKLSTTNVTWEQAGEWRLILDILSGPITGKFTCFMPAFSIMEYSELRMYITNEGTTYFTKTKTGFDKSLAGPSVASEDFSNNESAGSDVVIDVASTTGFYEGNQVFVSDSANSEWTRIKSIATNESITVNTLSNSYTIANSAKLEIFDYTKTPAICPIQRGMMKSYTLKASENSGIVFQLAIPQEIDPSADISITLQYLPTAANPTSLVTKWRSQYLLNLLGDDIPDSIQYGTIVEANITPPTTVGSSIASLCTIPAATHAGKHALAMKINRLGADSGDTYTGDIKLIAFVILITNIRLGYEA